VDAAEARRLIRAGGWRRPTAGLADGFVQANLVVLPAAYADAFREFCALNPAPCPLLDVTSPGSATPERAAPGADLRLDLPRYRVYQNGQLEAELDDICHAWQDDFVAFLLGCSYTFEPALSRAGVPLRHIELGRNIAMFRTNRECVASGPFHGPLVVSMRPVPRELTGVATAVTSRFAKAHGAPVHIGDPVELGIANLDSPDYGDPLPVADGEVPVFWACGVTPQAAAEAAHLPLMITHAPGYMFITDLHERDVLSERTVS
jgi:uncharacterized protein YcsI (UPF0317 family)